MIYVGCAYNAWCKISYREVSYEYALDELMQKMRTVNLKLKSICTISYIFSRQGEACWIQGDVKSSVIFI